MKRALLTPNESNQPHSSLGMRSLTCAAISGLSLFAFPSVLTAQPEVKPAENKEPAKEPAADPKPLVQKLENGNYKIGKITFNKDSRAITIPAQTNIVDPETFLEYLLVHLNGEKVHESLLVTEADPTNLNLALKLLSYKESPELFRVDKPDGTPSDKFPVVAEDIRQAARFSIEITWKDKGVERTRPITQWIQHRVTKKPMPDTPWVYNGSYIHNQKFKAKLTGSMLTIFPDPGSIANYPGDDRDDDTLWLPAPNIPAEGSAVTVTLKPWKK
ncbi:hypothetical protein NT6N_36550 [Oceaniferula spumae]|uniref:Uncharacterized protein n=1 Tax=Oceaniferula spumae TaxID=2979115 RepID=A0AAT9FRR0_9BACT